jgi:type IV secretory pathway VirB2 component (pilin)
MKLIALAAVAAVCLALLAGKDDIKRFQRMRSM